MQEVSYGRGFCGPCGAASARFSSIARGLSAPGPLTYFCRAAKVGKNAPEPMVLDSFLGAALGRPPRRGSKGPCGGLPGQAKPPNFSPPSAALVLVELRLPPFQRGTARGAAFGRLRVGAAVGGLTPARGTQSNGTFCKFAPLTPDHRAECREATSTSDSTVRRSKQWHRPRAWTIERKSEGRSVTNIPRNSGRFLGNVVS